LILKNHWLIIAQRVLRGNIAALLQNRSSSDFAIMPFYPQYNPKTGALAVTGMNNLILHACATKILQLSRIYPPLSIFDASVILNIKKASCDKRVARGHPKNRFKAYYS
jgi:hypothetical protein